jgi:hypothetical protein
MWQNRSKRFLKLLKYRIDAGLLPVVVILPGYEHMEPKRAIN